jgi:hypothetical protein
VHAGAALFAGGPDAVAVRSGQPTRVEQECRRSDVLAAGQDRGDDLGADGAGAPLNDGFDNNSVKIEITIN